MLKNLTNTPAGEFRPAWSPDGKWLAFSSDRESTRPRGNGGFETVHSTELYVVRSDGAQQRRLTNDQAFAGSPSWSADGQSLVFYRATIAEVDHITSPRRLRGITQIATLNLRAAERHDLTSGPGEKWSPRWLAGDRVAYVSGGPDGGIERTGEIAGARGEFGSPSWTADGRRMVFHREVDHEWPPHRTVHSLDAQFNLVRTGVFPSFSPAGDRMISNDRTAGILQNSILVMNADGSNRSVLFSAPDKSALAPAWSPRGSDIAFSIGHFFQMVTGPARGSIAIVHIDGTGLQLLTDDSVNCGFPSWSRDGEQIVYRASGASEHGLFVIDIRTHASRLLTSSAAHDNFPAWSPTSDVIAFTSDRDGDYEVYTIRANGMDLQRLTHSPGNDAHNSWSPDGKWIAFTSQRGGFKDESALHPYNPQPYGDIYVMHADGSDVRQLTDDQFEESTPVWAPLRGVQ